jgi:cell division protein FtsI/penicillin-binding protein 2
VKKPSFVNRNHAVAVTVLLSGFLLGKGAARALDLGNPPEAVGATTTVGLTPEPAEGQGLRQDDDDEEAPSAVAAAPQAPAAPSVPAAAEDDEDDAMEQAVPVAPAKRRSFEVGTELKLMLDTLKRDGRTMTAKRGNKDAVTTLQPELQAAAEHLLSDYRVPAGAVVALDPRTGAVLAAAGHSEDGSFGRELAVVPLAPAASVFKIVTTSALLEKGVSPDKELCFSGGKHRVHEKDLKREGGSRCVTFSQAMAKSANIPFARLTQENLHPADLRKWAGAFMFNTPLPRGVPASPARIPETDTMDFFRTGAGFGDVRMSALHGALLASTVANKGLMPAPVFFKGDEAGARHRVLDEARARTMGAMMEMTVTEGTARKAFRERRRNALGDIRVAGKTGSLAEQAPFRDYSWFVGYAPADNPTVAVAVFVMNNAEWRIRASYVAREMLRAALIKGHKVYRPVEDVAAHR